MLGKKMFKENLNDAEYAECAIWCNENSATIVDRGEYYECVAIPPPPPPTPEELKKALTDAVQDYMDETAKAKGYDNIFTVCTYIDTGVEQFDEEGRKARAWRSACWSYCYAQLDLFEAGEREIPTAEELIAELPRLEW